MGERDSKALSAGMEWLYSMRILDAAELAENYSGQYPKSISEAWERWPSWYATGAGKGLYIDLNSDKE